MREVSERDYGIDCYIEIVWNGHQVTGDLCSLQSKGTQKVDWLQSPINGSKKARLSGIDKSTINYWMGLPIPVFLVWADLESREVFWAPVKKQVRERYAEYLNDNQETMGFDFHPEFHLGTKQGDHLFVTEYTRERLQDRFLWSLTDLLVHHYEYISFMRKNQHRDCFMEVEIERELLFCHIYQTCQFMARCLGIEWQVVDLRDAYVSDSKEWNSPFGIHELTLSRTLAELEPIFTNILLRAKDLIVQRESTYWKNCNGVLYKMCLQLKP